MIYAIDFDGTIVKNAWPEIGELKPEAEAFISQIQRDGEKWILWTLRAGEKLDEAIDFLREHGLHPDAVNDNLPEVQRHWPENPNPRKVFADVYIDECNAGGLKWPKARVEEIPYWCKVGQVVYHLLYKKFGRIVEVDPHRRSFSAQFFGQKCLLGSGDPNYNFPWKIARVVPWTFRTAPVTAIKVRGINEHGYADVLSLDFHDRYDDDIDNMADFWSHRRLESFAADRYTDDFEQLNGMPCGTLKWWDGENWIKEEVNPETKEK